MLRNDDLGAALVQLGDDRVAVKGFVGDPFAELDAVDQRADADGVEAMPGQERKANLIAERVGEKHADRGINSVLSGLLRIGFVSPKSDFVNTE